MPIELELCPLCGYAVRLTRCFVSGDYVFKPKISCSHCGLTKLGGVFRQGKESDHELMERTDKLLVDSWNNQVRIKSLEQDIRFLCDTLKKISDIAPTEYTDEDGVKLSCAGCNGAAILAMDALRYIPEDYKNEDSF